MRRHTHPGFTLMELLTVLSILWILAALLMPVIQRARDYAHQSVCASNARQLGHAFQMYLQDYDDRVPFGTNSVKESPLPIWPRALKPYLRTDLRGLLCPRVNRGSSTLAYAPDSPGNRSGYWPGDSDPQGDYLLGIYYPWGYNYVFLSPMWRDCPERRGERVDNSPQPVTLTEVADPADTILLVDSTIRVYDDRVPGYTHNGWIGYYLVDPPGVYWPEGCLWWYGGWRDDPWASDGRAASNRHPGGAVTLFLDGHAKAHRRDFLADVRHWDRW